MILLAEVAVDPAVQVGAGRIIGGWEYIYAGYAVAAVALGLYTLSLWLRRPRAPSSQEPTR